MQTRFYEDSSFGKSDRRFYEDRLMSGRVITAAGLTLDLAVLADGIGGENAGERAAEITIQTVFEFAKSSTQKDVPSILQTALELANARVYLEAQSERHKRDMGSTAAVAAICEERLYMANVGDSQVFLARGKDITQLTVDHTWGNEMVRQGTLTLEEAAHHPERDDLMRSIGYEPQIRVDLGLYLDHSFTEERARENQGLRLQPSDRVIVCSDGLTRKLRRAEGHVVEPAEIVQILSDASDGEAARMLVDKALERKTDDNVSVIVMEIPGWLPFHFPKRARVAFISILVVGLLGLVLSIPALQKPPAAPTLPPIEISHNQAYVAKVSHTTFQIIPPDNEARTVLDDQFIDFTSGTLMRTSSTATGYAFIGLPGRAELFMAPDSVVKLVSSDNSGVVVQLDQGYAVLNLRPDFPQGRRLTVFSPMGAETWISGSKMCLSYEPQHEGLQMECIEDRCGYRDENEQFVAAGYRVDFNEAAVSQISLGLQMEACQFVPGLVPPATATVTSSPTTKADVPLNTQQLNATATARGYRTSTPGPIRTRFITPTVPSRTPTVARTSTTTATGTTAPTRTPTDTPTPVPPTDVPTDTPTPMPPTDVPTDTPTPVPPTDVPTDTPTPAADNTTSTLPGDVTLIPGSSPTGSQGSARGLPEMNLIILFGMVLIPGTLVVRTVRRRS